VIAANADAVTAPIFNADRQEGFYRGRELIVPAVP
jgi:hypothetical protein